MGRGSQNQTKPAVGAHRASGRRRANQRPRPFISWDDEDLDRGTLTESDRARRREIERELWRRPGGSGFHRGQKVGPLTVQAIDPDRLHVIVALEDGGLISLTQRKLIRLLSDGRVPYPTTPDRRKPPEPYDYGQHAPAPKRPPPSHVPIEGHPESVEFAAEAKRLADERERMSMIRMQTDIVEFERLYWRQAVAQHQLAVKVQQAGGLDRETEMWGIRYVHGLPERTAAWEAQLRAIYQDIQGIRDRGGSAWEIIDYLEEIWGPPFAGPTPDTPRPGTAEPTSDG